MQSIVEVASDMALAAVRDQTTISSKQSARLPAATCNPMELITVVESRAAKTGRRCGRKDKNWEIIHFKPLPA